MKAVAYNIKDHEKESLAVANGKIHDLTLISNLLTSSTIHYAYGKEVVIISVDDHLDNELLEELQRVGVGKVITRSITTDHIDLQRAHALGIQITNTPCADSTPQRIAEQTIRNLNLWGGSKCVAGVNRYIKESNVVDASILDNETTK